MLSSTTNMPNCCVKVNFCDIKYKFYVTKPNVYWVEEEYTTQKLHDWIGIDMLAVNREYVFKFFTYTFKATLAFLFLTGW